MARHNPVGGNLPGKKADRARTSKCRSAKLQGKWKEISAEIDAVGTAVKEKTNTWNKSCKESVMIESELYKMGEAAPVNERQEQKERCMIKDLLEHLQKSREEEDEARELIERCLAISWRTTAEVWKWNGSWTEYSGNTLTLLRKRWDTRRSPRTRCGK